MALLLVGDLSQDNLSVNPAFRRICAEAAGKVYRAAKKPDRVAAAGSR